MEWAILEEKMSNQPMSDYPRLKVMSFMRDDKVDFYRLMRGYRILSSSEYALDHYHIWQSETFGDWWEAKVVGVSFGRGGQIHYGLFPIDEFRPLRLGETFKAIRQRRLSKRQTNRRQQLRQQGKIEYQTSASEADLQKALRELVWEGVEIRLHRKTTEA